MSRMTYSPIYLTFWKRSSSRNLSTQSEHRLPLSLCSQLLQHLLATLPVAQLKLQQPATQLAIQSVWPRQPHTHSSLRWSLRLPHLLHTPPVPLHWPLLAPAWLHSTSLDSVMLDYEAELGLNPRDHFAKPATRLRKDAALTCRITLWT